MISKSLTYLEGVTLRLMRCLVIRWDQIPRVGESELNVIKVWEDACEFGEEVDRREDPQMLNINFEGQVCAYAGG